MEQEVLMFYGTLIGYTVDRLDGINLAVMRKGNRISQDQMELLIQPVTNQDILDDLKGTGDNKTPGLDRYGASFFKQTWKTVGDDVCTAVRDFFNKRILHKGFNCSVVALIPKSTEAKMTKDFRPISCCTTIYKSISRILTARLGKVISTLIRKNQVAFVKGQHFARSCSIGL